MDDLTEASGPVDELVFQLDLSDCPPPLRRPRLQAPGLPLLRALLWYKTLLRGLNHDLALPGLTAAVRCLARRLRRQAALLADDVRGRGGRPGPPRRGRPLAGTALATWPGRRRRRRRTRADHGLAE